MAESKHLASAVRGIQVSLEYRPDVSGYAYSAMRRYALQQHRRQCETSYKCLHAVAFHDQLLASKAAQEFNNVGILDGYLKDWGPYYLANAPVTRSQKLLHKGYTEYCRLHNEQREILRVGCFAGALVKAAASMPGYAPSTLRSLTIPAGSTISQTPRLLFTMSAS